jgi:SAM-dependent methyltransferase
MKEKAVCDRLLHEAEEYDERAGLLGALESGEDFRIAQNLHSNYIMFVRFNTLMSALRKLLPPAANVLSCGCGPARYEIAFANAGYNVWAYDNSAEMVNIAQMNFKRYGARASHIFQANELSIGSELRHRRARNFDLIWGASILHHLADGFRLTQSLREFVGPKTIGVFMEPVSNPLANWFRKSSLNIYASAQTETEEPLSETAYKTMLGCLFSDVSVHYRLSLFSGAQKVGRKVLGDGVRMKFSKLCFSLDQTLECIGLAKPLTWHAVIIAKRPMMASEPCVVSQP